MAEVKFTKGELRSQQIKLSQLEKYLPTLQLKKAMLQSEVMYAQQEIDSLTDEYLEQKREVLKFAPLLSQTGINEVTDSLEIKEVKKHYDCIAGVDIPYFEEVVFKEVFYLYYDKPFWFDDAIMLLRAILSAKEKIKVSVEKKKILEGELREVSIRVNLFEKIMIPRTLGNIKKIKVFLGDQQLAAVSQAKIAKRKILASGQ